MAEMHDQQNCPSVPACELMSMRLVLIKKAHSVSPSQLGYAAANRRLGWSRRSGGAAVSPGMSAYGGDQLNAEAAIMKEVCKARGEGFTRGQDRGRGSGQPPARGGGGQ
eukprot:2162757-Pyramimonas_sp.AAC.1